MLSVQEIAPAFTPPQPAITNIQFAPERSGKMVFSFGLLLVFVLLLYTNLPVLFPALEVIRPAQLTAVSVLVFLAIEVVFSRRGFEFAWPEGWLLIALLAAACLSCVSALWPRLAFESVVDLGKMVLIFFAIVNCVNSQRRVRCLIWVMLIGGLAPALGALRNYAAGHLIEGRAAWVGLFANPNELAYSLVVLLPLAACLATDLGWFPRLAIAGIATVYLAAIFVTFSRGGLFGMLAVVFLYARRRRSAVLLTLVALLAVGGLVFAGRYWSRGEGFSNLGGDVSFQQRIATSKAGLAMFVDHPLIGVGLGCSLIAWPLYAPADLYTKGRGELITHNTFIQPLSETGIAGFLAFVLFLGFGFRHAGKLAGGSADSGFTRLGAGLEAALGGFAACGLSGGYLLSWFPYLLVAISCATRHAAEEGQ